MGKVAGLLENANDFFEAAKRCGWREFEKDAKNYPLYIPEKVNMSFACELYLKAIAENKKVSVGKIHSLDKIFFNLPKDVQERIYELWRCEVGQVTDCEYISKMFFDNLEANSKVFMRFRYANEWASSVVSLNNSFTKEQFDKFSQFSLKRKRGSPVIYDGFLNQLALVLKMCAEEILGKTYNSY